MFFFHDTASSEIYTLSLHDALPIWLRQRDRQPVQGAGGGCAPRDGDLLPGPEAEPVALLPEARVRLWRLVPAERRSEEHTSELQSQFHLVCRLLLEKKKRQEVGEII